MWLCSGMINGPQKVLKIKTYILNMKIFCSEFQSIHPGFKVQSYFGIFFMETSDYFTEILWSSYSPCSQL